MKVGFVLLSRPDQPIPSTRVAVLNMLPLLRSAGVQADVVFAPETPSETPVLPDNLFDRLCSQGYDIVVFQKVRGPAVMQLAKRLRAAGLRTVYLVCDLVDAEMAELTDATVVVTDFLRSLYPPHLAAKLHVVHDGIERPELTRMPPDRSRGSKRAPLRAVLVTSARLDALPELGSPPDWLEVTVVGRYAPRGQHRRRLDQMRWALADQAGMAARLAYIRFLAHPRIHCEAWHAEGVYRHLEGADVGIIPINATPARCDTAAPAPAWQVKSENRLTLKMAIGLPVVTTPIPAYEPVIEHGVNGFLAHGRGPWLAALTALRDPDARLQIGDAARASVLHRFSMQSQARRLLDVFSQLVPPGAATQ